MCVKENMPIYIANYTLFYSNVFYFIQNQMSI